MDILNIKCIPRRTSLDVSSPSMYTVTILNTEKRDWGEGSSHAGRVVFVVVVFLSYLHSTFIKTL